MTFTVGLARPRPGEVRPRPGPQTAKLLLTSPGLAGVCKFQACTRPGPQNIIESWPGPAHGLRAGPARAGPYSAPARMSQGEASSCISSRKWNNFNSTPVSDLEAVQCQLGLVLRLVRPVDNNGNYM